MTGTESYNALLSGAKYIGIPNSAAHDAAVNLSSTHSSEEVTAEELQIIEKTWQKSGSSLPNRKKNERTV